MKTKNQPHSNQSIHGSCHLNRYQALTISHFPLSVDTVQVNPANLHLPLTPNLRPRRQKRKKLTCSHTLGMCRQRHPRHGPGSTLVPSRRQPPAGDATNGLSLADEQPSSIPSSIPCLPRRSRQATTTTRQLRLRTQPPHHSESRSQSARSWIPPLSNSLSIVM